MLLDSPYTQLRRRKDRLAHTGFEYQGKILQNTMSNQILAKGGVFKVYLQRLDDIWTEMVEQIKSIRVFANFAADKNERRIP